MEQLIKQIKADLLIARKNKNPLTTNLLTVLVGDAEKVGKDKGNREPTNDEVLSIVKKMIESAAITSTNLDPLDTRSSDALAEIRWLKQYLPIQLSRGEIYTIINQMPTEAVFALPTVMQYFKNNYANRYDGKELAAIVKEMLTK